MLTTPVKNDPRAWRADTVDAPTHWYYPLSDQAIAALAPVARRMRESGQAFSETHIPGAVRAACAESLAPVAAALETGRGFAVVTPGSIPREDWPPLYWLIGELLGRPFAQNVQGTLLYDVKDTGQDVRYGARFSVTNAESTFHTDNSFGDDILDYVGLLCINSARSGGESQIVSGFAVLDELRARYPEALEQLRRPFHVDRRGGLRPGDAVTARFPIFGGDDRDVVLRYLRYWIEVGHEKVGIPLTAEQLSALDTLDRVANEPRLRVQFMLRPGEMFFINNRWILHNRTAFEDHAEPERKRHYVRLWLQRA